MPGHHKFTGVIPPASTPAYVGDHYTDKVSKVGYVSVGTDSSADWKPVTNAAGYLVDGDYGDVVVSASGTVISFDPTVVTAAAKSVLDDATVSAMVDTLFGAASSGTGGAARLISPSFTTPSLGVASATSLTASGQVYGAFSGCSSYFFGPAIYCTSDTGFVGFGSANDAYIRRIAPNHLGLSNASAAQSFSVYNVAGTDYERGVIDWQTTSNVLTIGTQFGGAGVARNIDFVVGGVRKLDYGITNANRWTSAVGFHATIVTSPYFQFPGTSFFASGGDGIVGFYNNAGTSFDRLQYGGTTSSFPCEKRRGATLETRLADDSALAIHVHADVTKAGAVSDSDFTNPVNGCTGWDTTNKKHYVRIGGTWYSSAAYT